MAATYPQKACVKRQRETGTVLALQRLTAAIIRDSYAAGALKMNGAS